MTEEAVLFFCKIVLDEAFLRMTAVMICKFKVKTQPIRVICKNGSNKSCLFDQQQKESFIKLLMSVYSGFATRQQETKYNNLVENLVIALKRRIIKFYKRQPCDEDKFKLLIKKIYKKMYILEKGKFMAPKYTTCFTDLIENLNIQIDYDTMSDASSMISQTFSLKKQQNDENQDGIKSRVILQSKKNFLETQHKRQSMFDTSTLSLKKKAEINGMENQEEADNKRSTSLGVDPINQIEAQKSRGKLKLRQLKQLKDIRGTLHMPRVEDFIPKKEEIEPAFFSKVIAGQKSTQKQKEVKGFRRQKYSRQDISVQDI